MMGFLQSVIAVNTSYRYQKQEQWPGIAVNGQYAPYNVLNYLATNENNAFIRIFPQAPSTATEYLVS
jgi:hypothetical protein